MLKVKIIALFVSTTFFLNIQAQDEIIDPVLIRLKARIISAADSSAVPYANIINNRTHGGTITNADGQFTIEMLNIDSLVVTSVGYQKFVLSVPYNYNGQKTLTFVMKPINYAIGEVQVKGEKKEYDLGMGYGKPTDIPPELRGNAFNEKPPILAALFNPISYWQYYLSRKEKQKRAVREAIALERNWKMHSENYNKEIVMKLTGLNESDADSFMVWFNAQDVLPYASTEYEVRASIIEYFEVYKQEKK
jgi:CarboxypepD_reg-like domain